MLSPLFALALTLAGLPVQAEDLAPAQLAHLVELKEAGKWTELAEAFEGLPLQNRGRYLGTWFDALEHTQRWARLLAVCEEVEPHFKGKPGYVQVLKRKLQALIKLDQLIEAARCCEAMGDAGEPFYYKVGFDYARRGQDWNVLESLATKNLALQPADPLGLSVKGEALSRMERFAEAEPVLQRAIVANPKDPWLLVNLSGCLNERKAWAESLDACNRALALDATLVEVRVNRGRAYFELARYQEAKDDYEAALVLLPGNAQLQENARQAQRYLDLPLKTRKAKK